jgi:glutaminyl-tRNA synthetase
MSTPSLIGEVPGAGRRVVSPNFITEILDRDLNEGKYDQVVTRFPPEPNGYLHIGHAKSICLNFGLAQDYGGRCHLRFDDTNPTTEDIAFVEAMQRDIRWLGFDWGDNLFHASDYFEKLYDLAVRLIKDDQAYVDSLSEEEIRDYRGTVTEPGRESPYRTRSVEENLELFGRMRAGEFKDGEHVLRAKIDMSAPNMVMRDPVLYRIRHVSHYRTGGDWCIYPLYDFAHGLSDAIEGVTHSLCTLEFENNRAIYDWLVDNLFTPPRPYQYEFGRHTIEYTVTAKRKLIALVGGGFVRGWDDPRLPTLAGLRRRGVTPAAIRDFVNRIGVSRQNSSASIALLEHSIRDDLNYQAPRVMAVLTPLKVVLTNYPEDKTEEIDASYFPHDVPKEGSRPLPFSRQLYIDRDDFMEAPPKGYKRLAPGREVRLRHAYLIRCDEVVKDTDGNVVELRCSYDPDTLGKEPADGRKIRGVIHWVSAPHALKAEMRLYDRLFTVPNPDAGDRPFTDYLNPEALIVHEGFVEPSIRGDPADIRYQFERQGYFIQDAVDSRPDALVFNRIVTLRDSWEKAAREEARASEKAERAVTVRDEARAGERAGVEKAPEEALTPAQRAVYARYVGDFGLSEADAAVLAADESLSRFFDEAVKQSRNPRGLANWIVNELRREVKERPLHTLPLGPVELAALVSLVDEGAITGRIAKEVFAEMLKSGGSPREIVKERGLEQIADKDALKLIVASLISANPDKVVAFRAGKTGLLGFFVGQVMRETKGKANPQIVQELVQEELGDTSG